MKINVDQKLKTFSGDEMKDDKEQAATLKWACNQALLAHYPKEEIDGVEKMARFKLAYRIDKGGEIDLSAEDVTKLKKLVGTLFTPLVVGQVQLMLEKKTLDDNGNEVAQEAA